MVSLHSSHSSWLRSVGEQRELPLCCLCCGDCKKKEKCGERAGKIQEGAVPQGPHGYGPGCDSFEDCTMKIVTAGTLPTTQSSFCVVPETEHYLSGWADRNFILFFEFKRGIMYMTCWNLKLHKSVSVWLSAQCFFINCFNFKGNLMAQRTDTEQKNRLIGFLARKHIWSVFYGYYLCSLYSLNGSSLVVYSSSN